MSPSSQRVWIEICGVSAWVCICSGRPLHRGCGLKSKNVDFNGRTLRKSPSSQRVWIEIYAYPHSCWIIPVALFTEGVDWNFSCYKYNWYHQCRPLHRGCGLKWECPKGLRASGRVALFTEGVDWNHARLSRWRSVRCRPLHRGCGLKYSNW